MFTSKLGFGCQPSDNFWICVIKNCRPLVLHQYGILHQEKCLSKTFIRAIINPGQVGISATCDLKVMVVHVYGVQLVGEVAKEEML